MRFRRKLPVWLGFLIIVAAVWAVVFLRRHAPPEPARLLPTADGFVYVDLKWMRYTDVAKKLPAVAHDPDYEQFIQATGFQFERDLQEAALAIHYASPENGGETRFSEVVVAKIDGDRLRTYLAKLSSLGRNLPRHRHLQHSDREPYSARRHPRLGYRGCFQRQ